MSTNFGTLGRASVDIDVRLDKLEAEFRKGQRQVERSTRRMTRSVDSFEQRIVRTTGAIVKWGAALAGVAGASAIGRLITQTARVGDEIAKTADKVGVTTEALQELRFAAERTGVGTRTLDLALQRFSRRIGEAANGSGELKAIIEETGIELRDAEGNIRPLVDILGDYADVIAATESDQEKLRLAFKAFDSEGAALVNTLNEGSAGLDAYAERARELGAVLDQETIQASVELQDALTDLGAATQGLANDLGPGLIGAATNIVNFLTNSVIPTFRDLTDALGDLVSDGIGLLTEAARGLEQDLTGGLTIPIPPRPVIEQATENIKALTLAVTDFQETVREGGPLPTPARASLGGPLPSPSAQQARIDEALEGAPVPSRVTAEQARQLEEIEPVLARAEAAARGFGSVFESAFEDAIFSTDSLTDSITALGEELARVALRVAVIEPIARSLGGALGGGLFGPSATAANGRVISGIGTSGGIINKPTIIPMARGGVLAGEAGREAILPLTRMSNGKLGVETDGAGAGPDVQIIDQRGASAPDLQRRTVNGPGGREQLQLVIRQEVQGMFTDGSVDPLLGAFGTRRPGTRRG